jgi:hypothetical protein
MQNKFRGAADIAGLADASNGEVARQEMQL